MLATPGRRLVQRRLVGLPIGMFLHLVLDGTWADTAGLLVAVLRLAWSDAELPELARGGSTWCWRWSGAAALWWCWRRFRLDEPDRRERFLRTGQLDRDVARRRRRRASRAVAARRR